MTVLLRITSTQTVSQQAAFQRDSPSPGTGWDETDASLMSTKSLSGLQRELHPEQASFSFTCFVSKHDSIVCSFQCVEYG